MYLWYGFKVFPVSLSFKCSVSKNASQHSSRKSLILVWLKVAIPKISCDNLSGEEMYSIHWICPVCVPRSSDIYPCASLACSNDFNYSDGFVHRLWWISADFFIGLKVVVYIPSKDIVGNDVTSWIFVSEWLFWDMKVSTHSSNPGISAIGLISPHASRQGCVCVCVCVCVFVYAYKCV
jgi:hypothetical protein